MKGKTYMSNRGPNQKLHASGALLITAVLALVPLSQSRAEDAAAQTAAPGESTTAQSQQPGYFDRITTTDGKAYDKVNVKKVDPDGLLVDFSPKDGGFGTAKIKFRNLPPDLQQRYAYDPARATEFENSQARGQNNWTAQNAAWMQRREGAQAEQTAREDKMREQAAANEHLRLESDLRRAEADQQRAAQPDYYPGWYGGGGWGYGGGYGVGWGGGYGNSWGSQNPTLRERGAQHPVGIAPSPVPKTMGPMRPLGR